MAGSQDNEKTLKLAPPTYAGQILFSQIHSQLRSTFAGEQGRENTFTSYNPKHPSQSSVSTCLEQYLNIKQEIGEFNTAIPQAKLNYLCMTCLGTCGIS